MSPSYSACEDKYRVMKTSSVQLSNGTPQNCKRLAPLLKISILSVGWALFNRQLLPEQSIASKKSCCNEIPYIKLSDHEIVSLPSKKTSEKETKMNTICTCHQDFKPIKITSEN